MWPRLRFSVLPHLHIYRTFSRQLASVAESKKPTNRHVSIDAEGNRITTFTYVSEPLGNPPEHGYGWPRLDFEEVVGRGEWIIKRKLGWGISSSTWLALDQTRKCYVAIKVLKTSENMRADLGHSFEFEALQAVTVTRTPSPHILKLRAAFNHMGKGRDGNHLCYVTQLHGGNVARLIGDGTVPFPFPLAKRIILHTLRGIAHMHKHGGNMSDEDITSWLISDPSRRHDPEDSPDGIVEAAVSQPFPLPSVDDAMERTFLLGDYSHAQPCSERPPESIAILPHRPPENVILCPWNEKTDIWQFGCLVYDLPFQAYELVTSQWLFDWNHHPEYGPEVNLLYQMMNVTGERFSVAELSKGQKTRDYFDQDGSLLTKLPYVDDNYSLKMKKLKHLSDVDIASTSQLLSRCLRLHPADRPSAADLLSDPFFVGVD
ncbi:Protein kinase dsk1 [Termitomyces sp. J132]|nr:Protein kinase dsk1 [Termitomyces sp. J132]